ncbi:hypothetical protein ACVWZM_008554 [Bradyrhizobium sp. USDA 4501]
MPAQNIAAAPLRNGGRRRSGRRGRRSVGLLLFKSQAELAVRLPQPFAWLHLIAADEQQLNVIGNANDTFEFHGGARLRELADRAVEGRPAEVEDDLSGQKRSAAGS